MACMFEAVKNNTFSCAQVLITSNSIQGPRATHGKWLLNEIKANSFEDSNFYPEVHLCLSVALLLQ